MTDSVASKRPVASRPPGLLLGEQLVIAGKLTESQVMRVVHEQIGTGLRFGEAAMHLGLLAAEDVQAALAQQYGYAYLSPGHSDISRALFAAYQPFGNRSEALRELRTQLLFRWFTDRTSTLAVTAARKGDGTSSLAANLAIVFAQLGERTALIDANFRRPSQHKLFGLNPADGLSGLLIGRASVKDVFVQVPALDNLFVLCAGALPPNPQELLSRVSFSYLLESAPANYDIVIVDTPPILECADAQIVVSKARGCLVSTRLNESRLTDLERVKALLQPTGSKLVGAVLNE